MRTRSEDERLVEAYLAGALDAAAEEEFFIRIALEDELRRTLRSYRIIDEALRKERDAVPPLHSEARRTLAAALMVGADAASPAPAPTVSPVLRAVPPGRARSHRSISLLLAALLSLLLVIVVVVVVVRDDPFRSDPVRTPADRSPAATDGAGDESDRHDETGGDDRSGRATEERRIDREANRDDVTGAAVEEGEIGTSPQPAIRSDDNDGNGATMTARDDSAQPSRRHDGSLRLPVEIDWSTPSREETSDTASEDRR